MIFYFSGTGNSLYAANYLLRDGESLFDMADCCRRSAFEYTLQAGESVGFVFPVYYGGLPSVVRHFVRRLKLAGGRAYIWAVITCGAEIYAAGNMLKEHLAASGNGLDAVFPLKMPDNCVILYELPSEEEQLKTLEEAETALEALKTRIAKREIPWTSPTRKDRALTAAMYPLYANNRGVKKFWTDESCVGCGICASRCPTKVIEMIDGRPCWLHDRCVRCMSCLRCNAVQFGKNTMGRTRWVHPSLRKKKHVHE